MAATRIVSATGRPLLKTLRRTLAVQASAGPPPGSGPPEPVLRVGCCPLAEPQRRSQKLSSINLAAQAPSMPIETLSIEQLADSEGETLRANLREFPMYFAFANNTISLMTTGIVGYVASRKAFGAYLSQVNVNLCLGLVSALRQHKVQTYSNLRHALEHFALAAYALHHTDDATYFDTNPEHPVDHEKLMKKTVYPWLKKAYPRQWEEVEKLKGYINRDHAHASILHAYRTLKGIEGEANTVKTNYIDMTDPKSIAADLIHVGHVAFTGFELIVEANRPVSVIVGKDGIEGRPTVCANTAGRR